MKKRNYFQHTFEFLVLEHRPDEETEGPASRILSCLSFSKYGMKLKGQPRYDSFSVVISAPQDGAKVNAKVEVISGDSHSFSVKFVDPSSELLEKLSWWEETTSYPTVSPSQSVDIGV